MDAGFLHEEFHFGASYFARLKYEHVLKLTKMMTTGALFKMHRERLAKSFAVKKKVWQVRNENKGPGKL